MIFLIIQYHDINKPILLHIYRNMNTFLITGKSKNALSFSNKTVAGKHEYSVISIRHILNSKILYLSYLTFCSQLLPKFLCFNVFTRLFHEIMSVSLVITDNSTWNIVMMFVNSLVCFLVLIILGYGSFAWNSSSKTLSSNI